MPDESKCLKCGAPLTRDAREGVCPGCLLEQALTGQGEDESADTLPLVASEGPGTVIGRYKLLQQIGQGGMGTVWMAEQTEPVRRTVALKVIKPGMDSAQVLARFEVERQALALMDHPNIARVLDGGAAPNGRPYFVMDLVKGMPLIRFCDEQRLAVRERLELFIQVCQAVQHAHQKGIIHRDLKPSNVLVALYDGKPVPKVIDFGLAKATGQRLTGRTLVTEYGAVLGSLEYMSPEQAELNQLDIDTRSDIYSLGVLLYELLTGTTPLTREALRQTALDEVLKRIREEEPPRPSQRLSTSRERLPAISAQRRLEPEKLTKVVQGELDWIVMKALEKDRSRRYETANGFARDLQRYLNDEPVSASPPTVRYRAWKFARKHRSALVTAGAFILVLLAGTLTSVWQAIRATRSEREAIQNGQAATQAAMRASRLAREAAYQLSRYYVREATGLLSAGDLTGSLVYFAEALRLDEEDTNRAWLDRLRIGMALKQSHKLRKLLLLPDNITQARFSADGSQILAVATENGTTHFRAWDSSQFRMVSDRVVEQTFAHIVLSPDGRWAVTYDALGGLLLPRPTGVRLWDLRSRTPALVLSLPAAVVSFSPDGHRVAVITESQASVWDTARGEKIATLDLTNDVPLYATFAPDGKRVALCLTSPDADADPPGQILVLDAESLRPLVPPIVHAGMPFFAYFHADGRRLVSTSVCGVDLFLDRDTFVRATGEARIWDSLSGKPLTPPLWSPQPLYQADLSPDGSTLITVGFHPLSLPKAEGSFRGAAAAQLQFWDVDQTNTPHNPFKQCETTGLITARFSPDGQRVLAGRAYDIMNLWLYWKGKRPPDSDGFFLDKQADGLCPERLGSPHPDFFVSFASDGHRCLVANKGPVLEVWELRRGSAWTRIPPPGSLTGRVVCLSGDGQHALVVEKNRPVLANVEAGNVTSRLALPQDEALSFPGEDRWQRPGRFIFSRDGKQLGYMYEGPTNGLSHDAVFAAWMVDNGSSSFFRRCSLGDTTNTLDLTFDTAGRLRVALNTPAGIEIYEANTWTPACGPLRNVKSGWNYALFRADASYLQLGYPHESSELWRLNDESSRAMLFENQSPRAFAGESILVQSFTNQFRIWDRERHVPKTSVMTCKGTLERVAYSEDGKLLITLSSTADTGFLQLWDALTGEILSPPIPTPMGILSSAPLVLTLGGSRSHVNVVTEDLSRWSLPLQTDPRPPEELARLAQWVSGRGLDMSGDLTPLEHAAWQALESECVPKQDWTK